MKEKIKAAVAKAVAWSKVNPVKSGAIAVVAVLVLASFVV